MHATCNAKVRNPPPHLSSTLSSMWQIEIKTKEKIVLQKQTTAAVVGSMDIPGMDPQVAGTSGMARILQDGQVSSEAVA